MRPIAQHLWVLLQYGEIERVKLAQGWYLPQFNILSSMLYNRANAPITICATTKNTYRSQQRRHLSRENCKWGSCWGQV